MNVSSRLRRIFCTVAIAGMGIGLPAAPVDAARGHHGHHSGGHHGGHRGHSGRSHDGHFGRHHLGHRGRHRFHSPSHHGGFHGRHGGLRFGLDHSSLSLGLGSRGHHRPRSYPHVSGHHDGHASNEHGVGGNRLFEHPTTYPDAARRPAQAAPGREPSLESSGWSLLRSGRPVDALREFANEAPRHPSHGLPKIGYALSTAASGDLERGSLAMRRAMRIDPDAAHYLVLDEELRGRIDQLVKEYDARARLAADYRRSGPEQILTTSDSGRTLCSPPPSDACRPFS